MAKPSVRQTPGARPRVLIVDDDTATVDGLRQVFDGSPFEIEVASSAEQAIERFRDCTYSVVIADVQLPGESGLEMVRRLSREAPATSVVVMTGHASVQTAVSALKLGAADYLVLDAELMRTLLRGRPRRPSRWSYPSRWERPWPRSSGRSPGGRSRPTTAIACRPRPPSASASSASSSC